MVWEWYRRGGAALRREGRLGRRAMQRWQIMVMADEGVNVVRVGALAVAEFRCCDPEVE